MGLSEQGYCDKNPLNLHEAMSECRNWRSGKPANGAPAAAIPDRPGNGVPNESLCESVFEGTAGARRHCMLIAGHEIPHQNGDWEWRTEQAFRPVSTQLGRIETGVEALGKTMQKLWLAHQDSIKAGDVWMKHVQESHGNILAAQDKLWQSLGAIERKLEQTNSNMVVLNANVESTMVALAKNFGDRLDAGLKGITDGCGTAIGELRESMMRNHQQIRHDIADVRETYDWDLLMDVKFRLDEVLATKPKIGGSSKLKKRLGGHKKSL